MISLVIEDFLPVSYQKYLFQNYKQSSEYRSYRNYVPEYLQGRPRSTILHCLERKTKALKYSLNDTAIVNSERGKFTVHSSKSGSHSIDFETPSCTCPDWTQWHIPCKHFFAIFNLYPNWSWNKLPKEYLTSSYLSMDAEAIQKEFSSKLDQQQQQSVSPTLQQQDNTFEALDEIPTHRVSQYAV